MAPVIAGSAVWCGAETGVQHAGIDAAAVTACGQPGSQPLRREPVGAVLAVEAGQEGQAHWGVDLGEQADGTGEHSLEVFAQLVFHTDTVADQVFAGSAGAAQREGGIAVGGQRPQPSSVGTQRVGEYERVEPVVLVAGGALAPAQVLDLVRADHYDRHARFEQRLDDRAVWAFDNNFVHTSRVNTATNHQTGGGVLNRVPDDFAATGIHDRYGMIVTRPIRSAGYLVGRPFGQLVASIVLQTQVGLLAARSSGEAP